MGAAEGLGRRAELVRLRQVAELAMSAYAVPAPSIRLIAHAWNTTYRVDSGDGKRYLLRIHRAPLSSVDQISAELAWLDALSRDTDLLVPQVVRRLDGRAAAVERAAGASRVCVLFRWISGRFLEVGLLVRRRTGRRNRLRRLRLRPSRVRPRCPGRGAPLPSGHRRAARRCLRATAGFGR